MNSTSANGRAARIDDRPSDHYQCPVSDRGDAWEEPPAPPAEDLVVLREIRDALRK